MEPSVHLSESLARCHQGIHSEFLRSCLRFPDRVCLEVLDRKLTYAEVCEQAASIAANLSPHAVASGPALCSLLASRTVTAFTGVLGILLAGQGVVPLNPAYPSERTRAMLQRSGATTLVVDSSAAFRLPDLLSGDAPSLLVVLPDADEVSPLRSAFPAHRFFGRSDLTASADWHPVASCPDQIAYLLFTSGSTGLPKGVGLLHGNLTHYLRRGLGLGAFSEHDRFCQFFDFTWDSHLFALWACWATGACACVPQPKDLLNPDAFLRHKGITVLELVPSTGHAMSRLGAMTPGRFPKLRHLRLGGEAVPVEQAIAWSTAAPSALVTNTYGPTECTVEVTSYEWNSAVSPAESENGIVPIGFPYREAELLVVDDALAEVAPGASGELLISGPQMAPGYWNDPEKTALAFIVPPGKSGRFYRTGDVVRRPAPGKPFCFLGRRDHQIKICGARIELGEIEALLRELADTSLAVAVGWPLVPTGAAGIVAFLDQPNADVKGLLQKLKSRLPNVMVPREIRLLERFPFNVNGKIDRRALLDLLERKA